MPPDRNQKRKGARQNQKDKLKKQPKQSQQEARDPSLSVSKIKGNLRQARRLSNRDDIDAEKRKETEQLLQELEAQLKVAQDYGTRIKLEEENAVKYHGIKFFERKKLTRRIKQTKTQLAAITGTEKSDRKAKKALTKELEALRIDLNYVLHFPKADRYIALFPDGEYAAPTKEDDSPVGIKRAEVRAQMKDAMQKSTLPAEPEEELRLRQEQRQKETGQPASDEDDEQNDDGEAEDQASAHDAPVPKWGTKWKAWKNAENQPQGAGFVNPGKAEEEEEDDFFE